MGDTDKEAEHLRESKFRELRVKPGKDDGAGSHVANDSKKVEAEKMNDQ